MAHALLRGLYVRRQFTDPLKVFTRLPNAPTLSFRMSEVAPDHAGIIVGGVDVGAVALLGDGRWGVVVDNVGKQPRYALLGLPQVKGVFTGLICQRKSLHEALDAVLKEVSHA